MGANLTRKPVHRMTRPDLSTGQADDGVGTHIGRRSQARVLVNFPASFAVDGVSQSVAVLDISVSGAQLRGKLAPPLGVRGRLTWEATQCECLVVWRRDNMFGVQFLFYVNNLGKYVRAMRMPCMLSGDFATK